MSADGAASREFGDLALPGVLPTPLEMIAYLDRFVLGQTRAKRDLATAVYNHYLGCAYADAPGARYPDLERQHILLLGPTGSGKTFLVRTLANLLNVPMVTASATSFAETGYVGQHTDDLIRQLMAKCDNDTARALRGIVFIDEMDKLKRSSGAQRDVSGEGVQNALLTMLDGGVITVPVDERNAAAGTFTFDVGKVLFVATGAFVGLSDIIRRRVSSERGLGFAVGTGLTGARHGSPEKTGEAELLSLAETADLTDFGMIPELLGRFSTITALSPLSRDDLVGIMTHGAASPLAKLVEAFAIHGVTLRIEPAALAAIADRALGMQTGARGLRRTLLKLLDDVDYRLPELAEQGVTEIVYSVECILDGKEPMLRHGDSAAKAPTVSGAASKSRAQQLREGALLPRIPSRGEGLDDGSARPSDNSEAHARPPGISNVTGWPASRITERLDRVKEGLDWKNTTGSARKWWTAFEQENQQRLGLVLRLAEELAVRRATITEFFLAYVYSNTDNIQANLHYLDYTRLKKEEEARRRPGGAGGKGAAGNGGQDR